MLNKNAFTKSRIIGIILAFLVLSVTVFSQTIHFGQAWLRYDADSSKIRIGRTSSMSPLRLAKEYDGILFDYNTSQFGWSNGLQLLRPLTDSNWMKIATIYKDTTFGETTWNKSWSLNRKYFNFNDSLSLKWNYKSEGQYSGGTSGEFYAINKIYVLKDRSRSITLTPAYQTVEEFTLPHSGLWHVSVQLEYEFEYAINVAGDVKDSIYAILSDDFSGENSYAKIVLAQPNNIYTGQGGQLFFTMILQAPPELYEYYIFAKCSNEANSGLLSLDRKILWARVTAELIN